MPHNIDFESMAEIMGFKKISPLEAQNKINGGALTLVDIREGGAYEQDHIPNALHLDPQDFKQFAATTDKSTPILVYCHHGFSSQQAAFYLVNQGFQEVYSLEGGFEKWKATSLLP